MPILQVSNLTKSYSGIKALDDVQLTLQVGEVHALMGENGAGKSTFMKILIGLIPADSGQIFFEGNELKGSGINDIQRKGISMIHQEILVIPELTVAQNIFLGREKQATGSNVGWLNDKRLRQSATELLEQMGVAISADIKMKYLSVAQMQMVEIAKAISNDAKVTNLLLRFQKKRWLCFSILSATSKPKEWRLSIYHIRWMRFLKFLTPLLY
jgi:inositol transport system ATP-binding protein